VKINVITVGKLNAMYQSVANHYTKMISKFSTIETIELKEENLGTNETAGDVKRALANEGREILKRIKEREYVILLAPSGNMLTSEAFSETLTNAFTKGQSQVTFIIGSSYGVSDEVINRANEIISFSHLTFPHQLARIMLYEQIFRAFKIKSGERYHK